jgi:hypothetical protein
MFKHREINHPQWFPDIFKQAIGFTEFAVADLDAQRTDRIVNNFGFVRTKENQIAVFGTSARQDFCQRSVMDIFDDRRLQTVTAFASSLTLM